MALLGKGLEAKRIQEASNQLRTSCWGATLNAFRKHDETIRFKHLWPKSDYLAEVCRAILEVEKEDSWLLSHLCELLLATGSGDEVVKLIEASILSPTHSFTYDSGLQFSLLHLACATGSLDVVSHVKKKERNSLWQMKDSQGYTPAQVCFSQEIKKAIPYGYRAHRRQLSSSSVGTITHIEDVHKLAAVPGGFYRFLVELQASGYNVNSEKNMKGDCLIHTIVRGGAPLLPHLLFLTQHLKADVNLPNTHGMTPLCLTAQLSEFTLAEVLICVLGANPNLVNPRSKWTPLHYGAASGSYQAVSVILERGADPLKEDGVGCSPEFYAMKNQQADVAAHIRQFCVDRNNELAAITMEGRLDVPSLFRSDLIAVNDEGKTLLMVAVENNHPVLVKKIVESVPTDVKDFKDLQNLQTAVTIASKLNYCRCLEILIKYDCHPAIGDIGQKLPLHYACSNHCAECVSLITGTERGLTGLQWAYDFLCKTGGTNAVIRLVSEAMKRRQLCIVSPALFQAAEGTSISGAPPPDVAAILEAGDDVNPENVKGEWPLYVAALNGRLKMMKELEQRGGVVLHVNQLNFNTTLHAAARSGSLAVVKYVVASMEARSQLCSERSSSSSSSLPTATATEGASFHINTRNLAGATALELAASEGHGDVLQFLVDHNASTCIPGSDGGLLSCRNYDGVQHLLEKNRKAHLKKIVRVVCSWITREKFVEVWQDPYDHNLITRDGETMIMLAAGHMRYEVFEFLVQSLVRCRPELLIFDREVEEYVEEDRTPDDSPSQSFARESTPLKQPPPPLPTSRSLSSMSEGLRSPTSQNGGFQASLSPIKSIERSHSCDGGSMISSDSFSPVSLPQVPIPPQARRKVEDRGYFRLACPKTGRTAAHYAATTNRYRNLDLILKFDSACLDKTDHYGNTPAHLAASAYHRTALKVLMDHEADLAIQNNNGEYPDNLLPHKRSFHKKMVAVRERLQQRRMYETSSTDRFFTNLRDRFDNLRQPLDHSSSFHPNGSFS